MPNRRTSGDAAADPTGSAVPIWTRYPTAISARTVHVTYGRVTVRPPKVVRAVLVPRLPSATQDGHWNPTAASTMQSGQIGRPHLVQLTPVSRSEWR
ncbi:hypothetical protein GCM10026982_44850 [Nocardiopsis aegyptia]